MKNKTFQPALWQVLRHGYEVEDFWHDIWAGVSVAVVALPLAMAIAIASNAKPELGLFTAIIAGLFMSSFGGSRYLIGGPTAAFIVIVSGILSRDGMQYLIAATLMAGAILMLAGYLKIGAWIEKIPHAVITGFSAGIGLIIFTSQLKDFLGLPLFHVPNDFIERTQLLVTYGDQSSFMAIALGLITVLLLLYFRQRFPRWPVVFLVVVLMSVAVWYFHLDAVTIKDRFGSIPHSFPDPQLPDFRGIEISRLCYDAFSIALLGGIESLLAAVVADRLTKKRHNPNTELVGQGLTNMVIAFFAGLPATGALARTATNIKAGARTPIAGLIHALVLFLFMVLFARQVSYFPLSVLAGILMVVAYHMSELPEFRKHLKQGGGEAVTVVVTFLVTILIDVTLGVLVGTVIYFIDDLVQKKRKKVLLDLKL